MEEDGAFNCPDAGKVDLIAVSKKSKHVGNEAHYFMEGDNEWVDYYPEEGVGDDPADFDDNNGDGIDDGCELEEEVACPCEVDDGTAGYAWRGALFELQQSVISVNDCTLDLGGDHVVREARGWRFYYGVYAGTQMRAGEGGVNDACYAGIEDTSGAINFSSDLPTARTQHSACVRLIDEAIGDPTDGQDCTL